ncbi:MAG: CCA tRNA nucleotidyltransferase [Hyphomonadaceae bacterium]
MPRLANQPWMLDARKVIDALEAVRPDCARLVGGCVRNALLGEPVADVDIATQLTPDLVEKACRNAGMAVHPTGIEHGTLTVVSDSVPYEVTTLRRDVETDGRRATVSFTLDWAEDAQRRDFRMNALYADRDGEIYDPVGGGLDDVAQRRIVFVGDAETRIRDDYLRILRFFRFQAWYGSAAPDPEGLAACGKLRSGLAGISVERIWMEMKKLLGAPQPLAALEAMDHVGVLDQLFVDAKGLQLLSKLVGLEIEQGFRPDPMLRFLALFWKDAVATREVANRLKMSTAERNRLCWAAEYDAPLWGGITDAEVRAAVYTYGAQTVADRAMLEWASGGVADWAGVVAIANSWERPAMPVSGEDLLARGVTEGPDIGASLRKLEEAWIASDFTQGKDELLALL